MSVQSQAKPGRWVTLIGFARHVAISAGLLICSGAQAQVTVGEGGTPTYSQAIAVPPSVAGMAPNIGLLYSSGGVNGPLGYGWSLQGISTITRCPAIKAIDGAARGVDYSGADKLCLDGQRLIQTNAAGVPLAFPQTNDSLGGVVREYRTEKDSFARVRSYGSVNGNAANGPQYFKVWTKSGQIYEYGNNANAQANAAIAVQGKSVVSAWAVSRISDTLQNFIDFQYEQRDVAWGSGPTAGAPSLGHEWNLVEVRYTGTASAQPANRIRFTYSDRANVAGGAQDRGEAYHQGAKNVSVRRLDAVRTYTNWPGNVSVWPAAPPATAVKVKTVKLSYDQGPVSNRSRLVKIQECAGSAETACTPPVSFSYSAGGTDPFTVTNGFNLTTEVLTSTSGNYGVLIGDFNGDGISDLIRWADTPGQNRLYFGSASGAFSLVAAASGGGTFTITDQNLFKSDGCFESLAADFDGDGLTDILRLMKATSPQTGASCGTTVENRLFTSTGTGAFLSTVISGIDFARVQSLRTDYYNCIAPPSDTYLPGCSEPGATNLGTSQTVGKNFYLIDVDADGRLDIVTTVLPAFSRTMTPPNDATLCASTPCTKVHRGLGGGAFGAAMASNLNNRSVYTAPESGSSSEGSQRRQFVHDVNGDGLADLRVDTGTWLSSGNGNFTVDPAANYAPACRKAIDANGDGRVDCLYVNGSAAQQSLIISDGTYTPKKTANFNLTAPGQELLGYGGGSQNAGTEVLDGYDGARGALLRWHADPAQNRLYIANGDGTFRESASFNQSFATRTLRSQDGVFSFLVGNFDGSGAASILRLRANPAAGSEATINRLYTRTYPEPADQLVSFTSSTGLTTTITWVTLTDSVSGSLGARYTSDRGNASLAAQYPIVDVSVPMQVVASTVSATGVGNTTVATEYSYAGLKAGYDGRGVQGFRETRRQTRAPDGSNLTVVSRYLQAFPYAGVAHTTETFRGALNALPASPLSRSTFTYCEKSAVAGAESSASPTVPCAVPASTKVHKPYLFRSVESGWDLNGTALPSVTTTNAFNDTGDPTSIIVTTAGTALGLSQTVTKTTVNQFFSADTSNDNWILGRLQRASQQSTVPNSLGSIAASFGTAPQANHVQGTVPPPALALSPTSQTLSRNNPGTVSTVLTASASGGSTPYSFAWTRVSGTRSTVSSATVASPTVSATLGWGENFSETWRVTLTDGTGAQVSRDAVLTFKTPSQLSVAISPASLSVNASAAGAASGALTTAASGGVAPLTYAWVRTAGTRTSISSATAANPTVSATLGWGENFTETWRVTVTDAASNTATDTVNVTFTSPAALSVSVTPASISENITVTYGTTRTVTRSATAAASGGQGPYTYAWTKLNGTVNLVAPVNTAVGTFETSMTATTLSRSGTFQVTVTDNLGQTTSKTVSVSYQVFCSGANCP